MKVSGLLLFLKLNESQLLLSTRVPSSREINLQPNCLSAVSQVQLVFFSNFPQCVWLLFEREGGRGVNNLPRTLPSPSWCVFLLQDDEPSLSCGFYQRCLPSVSFIAPCSIISTGVLLQSKWVIRVESWLIIFHSLNFYSWTQLFTQGSFWPLLTNCTAMNCGSLEFTSGSCGHLYTRYTHLIPKYDQVWTIDWSTTTSGHLLARLNVMKYK